MRVRVRVRMRVRMRRTIGLDVLSSRSSRMRVRVRVTRCSALTHRDSLPPVCEKGVAQLWGTLCNLGVCDGALLFYECLV